MGTLILANDFLGSPPVPPESLRFGILRSFIKVLLERLLPLASIEIAKVCLREPRGTSKLAMRSLRREWMATCLLIYCLSLKEVW
jgi:hypothetical protein